MDVNPVNQQTARTLSLRLPPSFCLFPESPFPGWAGGTEMPRVYRTGNPVASSAGRGPVEAGREAAPSGGVRGVGRAWRKLVNPCSVSVGSLSPRGSSSPARPPGFSTELLAPAPPRGPSAWEAEGLRAPVCPCEGFCSLETQLLACSRTGACHQTCLSQGSAGKGRHVPHQLSSPPATPASPVIWALTPSSWECVRWRGSCRVGKASEHCLTVPQGLS